MSLFPARQGGTGMFWKCERVHDKTSGKILAGQSEPKKCNGNDITLAYVNQKNNEHG